MTSFKTSDGSDWVVAVNTQSAKLIKSLCKDRRDQPIDLLEFAETGRLDAVTGSVETVINVVFVLCLDEIRQRFDLAQYDEANADLYLFMPELKDEPALTKASRWFGALIDGSALTGMMEAFQTAMVNFIPSENRRNALKQVLAKEKELEALESDRNLAMVSILFDQAKPELEKILTSGVEKAQQALKQDLAGLGEPFGETPESSGSIPAPSASGS